MKTANILNINFSRYFSLLIPVVTSLCLLGSPKAASAQTYKVAAGSLIQVDGTSNLHDWKMKAQSFSSDAQLVFKGTDLQDVTALNFTLPVQNLKSNESLMDTRAYKALKEEQNKNITFKLTSATVTGGVIKANGNLTIAGVTKEVALQAKSVVGADGSVTITGSRKVKMSEFGIKPPTFMMGALKVGDEITIDYTLKLKK